MTQDLTISVIKDSILTLPDRPPFMLASQLADFYETKTKRVTEACRRNPDRFPDDFVFELTELETAILRPQNAAAMSEMSRSAPLAFTQIGSYALSGCLKSPRAAQISVLIHRAFVQLLDVLDNKQTISSPTDNNMVTVPTEEYIDLLKMKIDHIRLTVARNTCVPLTEEQKEEIARLKDAGLTIAEIHHEVGRHKSTIRSYLKRRAYGHA